jgi:hypothetical protein
LKADDQELWRRDNITVTWLSNKEEYTDIQLPNDVAFDTLRVEITEWARPGAGLSEMEIHDSAGVNVAASRRIFSNSHLVVRGVKRKTDFSAVALTDGITSSKTWGKGYWLAADNKHAWIEFRTKNE